MNLSQLIHLFETAPRLGADEDQPEGARYIQLSETLVNQVVSSLEKLARTEAEVLEKAAQIVEGYVSFYPADIFPADSHSRDAIAGTTLRQMLPRIAKEIRKIKTETPIKVDPPLSEEDKLIIELMHLAYLIQVKTDYCVFIDLSGHVSQMSIRVCESKERWQNVLVRTEFYTDLRRLGRNGDPLEILRSKVAILRRTLEEKGIPYEDCDVDRYEVEEHSF